MYFIRNIDGEDKRTDYFRRYRMTDKGKNAVHKSVKNYESKHPERKSAWRISKNILTKPCEVCGKYPVHRHHPDISKPLEVIFLCPRHHKEAISN